MNPLHIRADAGGTTGTGHIMRMIALAQAYQRRSGSTTFICAQLPEALEQRLVREGCDVVRIDAEPGSEADAEQTLSVFGSRFSVIGNRSSVVGDRSSAGGINKLNESLTPNTEHRTPNTEHWLVLDGYHFDYAYQKGVRDGSGLRLLCVDDHGYSERWYCDAILNQNLDAEKRIDYQTERPDTKLLLGASYCLLRREFLQAQRAAKGWGRIQSLLVTLGGSDPDNATGAVLQLLHQVCPRPLDIRVLLGADNPHLAAIQAFESHHRIEVLQGVSNMTEQYAWADGIISAGGSTCWEWLYFGLPGAIVTIADNQLPIVEALTKTRRVSLSLGWFHGFDFQSQGQILSDWLDEPESRVDRSEVKTLIDGYGSARAAGFLLGRKLTVREALARDCELYFKWANDPDVRKNAFSPDPIPMEKHIPWFESRLESRDSCLLLGVDFEGSPVGQIRFDYEKNRKAWVIDISTDQQCRGKGIGKQLILEGINWMCARFGQSLAVEADVIDSNIASMRLFQSAGLEKVRTGSNFTTFARAK